MSQNALYWIEPGSPPDNFPPVMTALKQPDGLLCFGGDLGSERLLSAYRRGIFPWYGEGQPIMWWSPSPRCVIYPDELEVRRSLRKSMRNGGFKVSIDQAFERVIHACAQPRDGEDGTWITSDMMHAYAELHRLGHAHSVEIWHEGELAGGLYGIAIGRVFFGESMFSTRRDASKIALVCLTRFLKHHGFRLIDAQVTSSHLLSLGAREIERQDFLAELDRYCPLENAPVIWQTPPVQANNFHFNHE